MITCWSFWKDHFEYKFTFQVKLKENLFVSISQNGNERRHLYWFRWIVVVLIPGIFMVNVYITYRKRVTSDHTIYLVEDKWTFQLYTKKGQWLQVVSIFGEEFKVLTHFWEFPGFNVSYRLCCETPVLSKLYIYIYIYIYIYMYILWWFEIFN